jgi:hypothetical protein
MTNQMEHNNIAPNKALNRTARRIRIVIIVLATAAAMTAFLYNESWNSESDAVTSASKNQTRSENVISDWEYTWDGIALPEEGDFSEVVFQAGGSKYRLLQNNRERAEGAVLVLPCDKQSASYQEAAQKVKSYLETEGYEVQVKNVTQARMLSIVHAGRFDYFLMSEEAK